MHFEDQWRTKKQQPQYDEICCAIVLHDKQKRPEKKRCPDQCKQQSFRIQKSLRLFEDHPLRIHDIDLLTDTVILITGHIPLLSIDIDDQYVMSALRKITPVSVVI